MALISQFVLRRSTLPRRAGSSARADILWLLLILVTTTMFSWKITLSSQFSLLTASEGVNQRFPAAPADQSVLRHQRERREDSNLDRRIGLRPRRHRPQANRSGSYSLPDSTDFERDAF